MLDQGEIRGHLEIVNKEVENKLTNCNWLEFWQDSLFSVFRLVVGRGFLRKLGKGPISTFTLYSDSAKSEGWWVKEVF